MLLLELHARVVTSYCAFPIARYYQLLQENMSPVQLVDFSQLNKQELPLQRPGPDFDIPVLVGSLKS